MKVRVDAPHQTRSGTPKSQTDRWTHDEPPIDWLNLHAADLIERLNRWADDLQRREANLTIHEAKLDQRSRQFRLTAQQTRLELDALGRRLDARQRQLDAHVQQCHRLARQLALAQIDPSSPRQDPASR